MHVTFELSETQQARKYLEAELETALVAFKDCIQLS